MAITTTWLRLRACLLHSDISNVENFDADLQGKFSEDPTHAS